MMESVGLLVGGRRCRRGRAAGVPRALVQEGCRATFFAGRVGKDGVYVGLMEGMPKAGSAAS